MSPFDITPAGVFVNAVEIAGKRAREHEHSRPLPPESPPVHVRAANKIGQIWTSLIEVTRHGQPATTRR